MLSKMEQIYIGLYGGWVTALPPCPLLQYDCEMKCILDRPIGEDPLLVPNKNMQ